MQNALTHEIQVLRVPDYAENMTRSKQECSLLAVRHENVTPAYMGLHKPSDECTRLTHN